MLLNQADVAVDEELEKAIITIVMLRHKRGTMSRGTSTLQEKLQKSPMK